MPDDDECHAAMAALPALRAFTVLDPIDDVPLPLTRLTALHCHNTEAALIEPNRTSLVRLSAEIFSNCSREYLPSLVSLRLQSISKDEIHFIATHASQLLELEFSDLTWGLDSSVFSVQVPRLRRLVLPVSQEFDRRWFTFAPPGCQIDLRSYNVWRAKAESLLLPYLTPHLVSAERLVLSPSEFTTLLKQCPRLQTISMRLQSTVAAWTGVHKSLRSCASQLTELGLEPYTPNCDPLLLLATRLRTLRLAVWGEGETTLPDMNDASYPHLTTVALAGFELSGPRFSALLASMPRLSSVELKNNFSKTDARPEIRQVFMKLQRHGVQEALTDPSADETTALLLSDAARAHRSDLRWIEIHEGEIK
jgi:hypothetical protein